MGYTDNQIHYAAFFPQGPEVVAAVRTFGNNVQHALSPEAVRVACQNRHPGHGTYVGPDWACEIEAGLIPLFMRLTLSAGALALSTLLLVMLALNTRQQTREECAPTPSLD